MAPSGRFRSVTPHVILAGGVAAAAAYFFFWPSSTASVGTYVSKVGAAEIVPDTSSTEFVRPPQGAREPHETASGVELPAQSPAELIEGFSGRPTNNPVPSASGGFHAHRRFPSIAELSRDPNVNPSQRVLDSLQHAELQGLLDGANKLLIELEEKKIKLAEEWAKVRIASRDFDFVGPDGSHPPPVPGTLSVTVHDATGEPPRLVVIFPGENAALDVLSLDIEAHYQSTKKRIDSYFNLD
jgi:hypothetical protein